MLQLSIKGLSIMARISEFICLSWYAMLPDLVILIKNKKTKQLFFHTWL